MSFTPEESYILRSVWILRAPEAIMSACACRITRISGHRKTRRLTRIIFSDIELYLYAVKSNVYTNVDIVCFWGYLLYL